VDPGELVSPVNQVAGKRETLELPRNLTLLPVKPAGGDPQKVVQERTTHV
jgi:hypothetical protein